jgi:DNA-directed RNA polymerase II subunit RPB2
MTIGHVIECLIAKLAAIKGRFSEDATPFRPFNMEDKAVEVHSTGYQKYGNELMFNPYSGKRLENLIFIGPIYYQRLRHLVDDKMYARARGPVVAITRQPTHGRSRAGGLRFGEMERDCIISHGVSDFLRERLFLVSDYFRMHVCSECGLMAVGNLTKNIYQCTKCRKVKNRLFSQQKFIRFLFPMLQNSSFKNLWLCISFQNYTFQEKKIIFDHEYS